MFGKTLFTRTPNLFEYKAQFYPFTVWLCIVLENITRIHRSLILSDGSDHMNLLNSDKNGIVQR